MTVEDVIRGEIVRLGNLEVPVRYMNTIGAEIAVSIRNLSACLQAKNANPEKGKPTEGNGGEPDAGGAEQHSDADGNAE